MAKKLKSVFTDDMDRCMFTGSPYVERHHIFGQTRKTKEASEYYGFIAPLFYKMHPNGANADGKAYDLKAIDLKLKQMAQTYFEEHYGSCEEFMEIFKRNYL